MIASNEAWNSELRLNVLDQIIQLFDYISIYCSSLTIEHSNSRWGFQLTIWLYIWLYVDVAWWVWSIFGHTKQDCSNKTMNHSWSPELVSISIQCSSKSWALFEIHSPQRNRIYIYIYIYIYSWLDQFLQLLSYLKLCAIACFTPNFSRIPHSIQRKFTRPWMSQHPESRLQKPKTPNWKTKSMSNRTDIKIKRFFARVFDWVHRRY